MGFRNIEDAKREKDGVVYYVRNSVNTGGCDFERIAIQTHFVERSESYLELVNKYVMPFYEDGDLLSVSEKIISMCQNNVVDKKDVNPGFWAKFLCRFAKSNEHGGMHFPHKFQLAINIVGLPKILWACICAVFGKLVGKKGVFYEVVGNDINGIDGFIDGSSFPIYSEIALLNPIEPDMVCTEIENAFNVSCMIVDANDFGVNVLGKSPKLMDLSEEFLSSLIKDNPAGQSGELTPFILIKSVASRSKEDVVDKTQV